MSINWNNAAERTIEADLGMIPEVGTLLSVLVSIFWPKSGEDVWSQIKDQVEQLIQKDISQEVYQDVQNNLNGRAVRKSQLELAPRWRAIRQKLGLGPKQDGRRSK